MQVVKELEAIQKVLDHLHYEHGFSFTLSHAEEEEIDAILAFSHKPTKIKGVTIMEAFGEGNVYTGFALCNENDNYDKVVGTKIAFRRMMESLHNAFGRKRLKKMLNGLN